VAAPDPPEAQLVVPRTNSTKTREHFMNRALWVGLLEMSTLLVKLCPAGAHEGERLLLLVSLAKRLPRRRARTRLASLAAKVEAGESDARRPLQELAAVSRASASRSTSSIGGVSA
jgi:hypothetical protein